MLLGVTINSSEEALFWGSSLRTLTGGSTGVARMMSDAVRRARRD
jgi:hypothetical protein